MHLGELSKFQLEGTTQVKCAYEILKDSGWRGR
jgi:hypothetical protein